MRVAIQNIERVVFVFIVALMGAAGDSLRTSAGGLPADASADRPVPSIQSGTGLAACLAWTDGCVTCRRMNDAIACSNPGIACQPGVTRCLEGPATSPEKRNDAPAPP
jgi:hypothetical protein